MAREEMIEMEGTVEEVLPNTQFRVRLVNGAGVLAYAGGKLRQRRIRIIAGDRVRLEMSPYDVTRGRISLVGPNSRATAAATVSVRYRAVTRRFGELSFHTPLSAVLCRPVRSSQNSLSASM